MMLILSRTPFKAAASVMLFPITATLIIMLTVPTFASAPVAMPDRPPIRFADFRAEADAGPDCPGWLAGDWNDRPIELFCQPWPFRNHTYEILFSSQMVLARSVYGLVKFQGDLDRTVTIARFERGAGGFHYDIYQVTAWANAIQEGRQSVITREERLFLKKLTADNVIAQRDGVWIAGYPCRHILGATAMKARSLGLNLQHERIHVLWDEDPSFRRRAIQAWGSLSDDEKQEVCKFLKGYNPAEEMQIIEEWAVFQYEKNSQADSWPKGTSE